MKTLIDTVIKHKVVIIIIFVFSITLFLHAGLNSYWLDEIYSVYMRGMVHESFMDHFHNIRIANPVSPLYESTLYCWMRIFGDNEVSTRTLSIIFVSISAFFLYLFTLRIFNKRIALTTVLLFLFSRLTIRYALDARYYSQMLLLASVSSYALLLYAESLYRSFSWKNIFVNRYFMILTLVNMALLFNHAFNYLFFIAQAIFVALFMLSIKSSDYWYIKIIKVLLIYVTPLLLIALLWH